MLFLTLMTRRHAHAGRKETRARRLDWKYPEGMNVLAEYWLPEDDPSVVVVAEAENVAVIFRALEDWDDVFEFRVLPAIPGEVGLAMTRQQLATATA